MYGRHCGSTGSWRWLSESSRPSAEKFAEGAGTTAAGRSSASEAAGGDTTVVVRLGVPGPCLLDGHNGP